MPASFAHGCFGRAKKRRAKKAPRSEQFLGSNAVDVSREHGAFLDVGDAEEASRDTLEADGEAAVRRHTSPLSAPLPARRRRAHRRPPRATPMRFIPTHSTLNHPTNPLFQPLPTLYTPAHYPPQKKSMVSLNKVFSIVHGCLYFTWPFFDLYYFYTPYTVHYTLTIHLIIFPPAPARELSLPPVVTRERIFSIRSLIFICVYRKIVVPLHPQTKQRIRV